MRAVHLERKGRGRALRAVWQESDAAVVAYMDVDLSTDLAALLPLVAPLLSGHSDVAIGTRLSHGSRVVRGARARADLALLQPAPAHDAAGPLLRRPVRLQGHPPRLRARLLPLVEDEAWFFDTELLVLAERAGLRIHEVPVDWVDDPDSRVDVVQTAVEDLRGMARLSRALVTGALPLSDVQKAVGRDEPAPGVEGVPPRLLSQALRFGAIGVVSTLAYLALFLLLRSPLGAQGANLAALLITVIANTAANRRLHVRAARPPPRRASPARRARHLRPGTRAHERRAGVAGRCGALGLAPLGARGPGHRQRPRHDGPLRALPRVGLPSPAQLPLTPGDIDMATTVPRPAVPAPPLAAAAAKPRSLVRPALFGLLAATAALYLWRLGSSGYANEYYAAAAQAGGESWKAWFFGALDSGQLDHRRQAAGLALDHGALGADLRPLELEHPRPAGARGRRRGRPAVRHRPAHLGRPGPDSAPARSWR